MILASHQPDLLPYSGFWFKMAKADLFDLKIYDQFQARGYQRRVTMRGRWASVPVVGNPSRSRIVDVRVDPCEAKQALSNLVVGRYRGARRWAEMGPRILQMIDEVETDHLWQLNLGLILGIRELLGIRTPVAIGLPPDGRGSAGLVTVIQQYNADAYLAGTGARVYMGDCREFDEAGIKVIWSTHAPASGDSILTLLMDHDDPMELVLAEHPEQQGAAR